tara:strand:+ start:4807 stop:5028 length:222 start_codon:yes stop_codon:yes gene_type:complete
VSSINEALSSLSLAVERLENSIDGSSIASIESSDLAPELEAMKVKQAENELIIEEINDALGKTIDKLTNLLEG